MFIAYKMLTYKRILKPLIKKSKEIFYQKFRIKIETIPKMHFLVKVPADELHHCIRESFSGTWETVTKMGTESSLVIDTFVTNERKLNNAVCNITVEELNSQDQVVNILTQTYKVAETMENWKWKKHIFNLTNSGENTINKAQ